MSPSVQVIGRSDRSLQSISYPTRLCSMKRYFWRFSWHFQACVTSVTATRYIDLLNRYVLHKRHSLWRIHSNSSSNPLNTTRAPRRDPVSSPPATTGPSHSYSVRRHFLDFSSSRLKKIKCLQPSPETKCEACRTAKIPCRFKDRERYFAERSRAIAGNSNTTYAGEPA